VTGAELDWTISDAATAAISRAISNFVRDYGAPEFEFYPVVTWRTGGRIVKPESEAADLPDRYDLGLIPRGDINASNFIAIANESFEVVAFVPRPEDAASSRRMIDHDGAAIVVR
jgi:hypothetical protein